MAVRIEPEEHAWGSKDYVDQWIDDARPRDEKRVVLLRKLVSFIPNHLMSRSVCSTSVEVTAC